MFWIRAKDNVMPVQKLTIFSSLNLDIFLEEVRHSQLISSAWKPKQHHQPQRANWNSGPESWGLKTRYTEGSIL